MHMLYNECIYKKKVILRALQMTNGSNLMPAENLESIILGFNCDKVGQTQLQSSWVRKEKDLVV